MMMMINPKPLDGGDGNADLLAGCHDVDVDVGVVVVVVFLVMMMIILMMLMTNPFVGAKFNSKVNLCLAACSHLNNDQ